MSALAKKKSTTRDEALAQAKVLHDSIAKRMSAAGLTPKIIKRDVLKASRCQTDR